MLKLKRIRAGEYETQDGTWTISRLNFGYGDEWLAQESHHNGDALDPFQTLAAARKAVAVCLDRRQLLLKGN
jgi:hypothetical protein